MARVDPALLDKMAVSGFSLNLGGVRTDSPMLTMLTRRDPRASGRATAGRCPSLFASQIGANMDREELKAAIDELMRQYADEEIDGATYAEKMMDLTSSAQEESDE